MLYQRKSKSEVRKILEELDMLTDEYYDFYIDDKGINVALDGEFGIKELELIIKLLKIYEKNK